MKTQTIEAISEILKKELGPSYWGKITLRIQQGEVTIICKAQTIKRDTPARNLSGS